MNPNPYQSPACCDDNFRAVKAGGCSRCVESASTVAIVLSVLSFVLATGMKLCTIGSDPFWSDVAAWSLIAAIEAVLIGIVVVLSE